MYVHMCLFLSATVEKEVKKHRNYRETHTSIIAILIVIFFFCSSLILQYSNKVQRAYIKQGQVIPFNFKVLSKYSLIDMSAMRAL